MKVLVVYQLKNRTDRNTINEHLFSFKKYGSGVDFHYINAFFKLPWYLKYIQYDAVILHYTYLGGERFLPEETEWEKKIAGLEEIKGYKVAIPQDEYDFTDRIADLFRKIDLKAIYTCFTKKEDIAKAYPVTQTGVTDIFSVFTGYVDEEAIKQIKQNIRSYKDRPIDIGYRARKLSAYFGKHGQLKYELAEFFSEALEKTDLIYDISNTNKLILNENPDLEKLGNKWYEFLLNCKAFIGCEGGSSLLDKDGAIQALVSKYELENPDAPFTEIEKACFPGKDYNINCFAVSPRHFEAALCKTLQVLVEGEYGGALQAWEHYIPLKRDFSNIQEVLEVLKDQNRCQSIIDKAYEDVVLSGKNTYRKFVNDILDYLRLNITTNSKAGWVFKLGAKILAFRNRNFWRYVQFERKEKYYRTWILDLPSAIRHKGWGYLKYKVLKMPRKNNRNTKS